MTAREALDRLRADPGDGEAWTIVRALLDTLARKETDDAALREGAVASVRRSLEDKLLDGDLPDITSPGAYLAKAIRWRVRDQIRRRDREKAAAERARTAPPAPAEVEDPLPVEVLGTLELVAERAITRRDPWQREHLRQAWRQILALQLERRSLREIVAADDGIDPGDEAAIQRAVQRAHKAHQRARAAFVEALAALVAQGKVDPESGDAARTAIGRLKRRQDRATPGVSPVKRNTP